MEVERGFLCRSLSDATCCVVAQAASTAKRIIPHMESVSSKIWVLRFRQSTSDETWIPGCRISSRSQHKTYFLITFLMPWELKSK